MGRQQLQCMNFKENRMEEKIVGSGSRRWVFFQTLCYEILQNAMYHTFTYWQTTLASQQHKWNNHYVTIQACFTVVSPGQFPVSWQTDMTYVSSLSVKHVPQTTCLSPVLSVMLFPSSSSCTWSLRYTFLFSRRLFQVSLGHLPLQSFSVHCTACKSA